MEGITIQLTDVTYSYGKNLALANTQLTIEGNHLVGVIGSNGAGKSTLFQLIAGNYAPKKGEVLINGTPVYENLENKKHLVLSNSDIPFPTDWKLKDIIKFYHMNYEKFDVVFAEKLFSFFDISTKQCIKQYSLGKQSIIKFIMTIAARAELTLLDEPVIGVDIGSRKHVYDIILRDYMEHPRTILISSHMLNEMEGILDHVLVLKEKRVCINEDVDVLREQVIRVDGEREALLAFKKDKHVLYQKDSRMDHYVIVEDKDGNVHKEIMNREELAQSRLSISEICMYQLGEWKEEALEELWSKDEAIQ